MTFARQRQRSLGGLLLAVALALVALHPTAVAGPRAASQASPIASSLDWGPCADVPDAECAGLGVPIDPARPDGTQLTLRLARLPALDPARSLGSVLLIPGGPGVGISATGGNFVAFRKALRVDELRETFDVVTFDPRGIGESSPIRCASMPLPDASATALNGGVLTAEEFEELAQVNAEFAESCFAATGELMGYLSAKDSAADIEQIRQALGQDDGLVAYGGSYGTLYGTAYLEQYGDRVKALVIDGVVDHSIDLETYSARWALATEDGFTRFREWCDQDPTCALHGQDVAAVYEDVAAAHPEVRPQVRGSLSGGRNEQFGWPALARLLAGLAQGEPQATPAPAPDTGAPDPEVVSGVNGQFRGVMCADYGPQNDASTLAEANVAIASQAPHFAWLYSLELPGSCAGWPREATNPPHRLHVGPHPNVLVANGTHDPATPLVAAVAVWAQIPQARLLIADVDGHQVLPFSQCSFEAMLQFLIDPSSLAPTTFCPD